MTPRLPKLLRARFRTAMTNNLPTGWYCTLELDNLIKTFTGLDEAEAIQRAYRSVIELEKEYENQQRRLQCEGCGE